jgi:hypothetical protein
LASPEDRKGDTWFESDSPQFETAQIPPGLRVPLVGLYSVL